MVFECKLGEKSLFCLFKKNQIKELMFKYVGSDTQLDNQ